MQSSSTQAQGEAQPASGEQSSEPESPGGDPVQPNPADRLPPLPDVASAGNVEYLVSLYDQYLASPTSLDPQWQAFFAGFALGAEGGRPPATGLQPLPEPVDQPAEADAAAEVARPVGIYDLVHTYREFGHFEAELDPLSAAIGTRRPPHPLLALDNFGLAGEPMDMLVGTGGFRGPADGTLGDLVAKLRETYCRDIGVEFTAIANKEHRDWLAEHMEPVLNRPSVGPEVKKHILRQLIAAEEFEQYLHRAFVGAKRFSIEGAEALIPLVNSVIETAGALGAEQVICAMAHRGRLNVLAHVLEKPYETMLAEFAGTNTHDEDLYGDGDVKYHLGYANTRRVKVAAESDYRHVKISLLPNPSHLELINPIQQGIIRCKQQWMLDGDRRKVVPITLHGDAAFVGQGVVFETLNLSELRGYRTGGTIHIIVNNQIGFTTPPSQGRFTPYPTDVAKAIQAPVFHVNGDDPEAVWHVAQLAIAFRQQFKKDVLIDLWCYRKYGHNEQDEPSFTQPLMYRAIQKHVGVRERYTRKLIEEGVITPEEPEQMKQELHERFKAAREAAQVEKPRGKVPSFSGVWQGFGRAPMDYREWQSDTAVPRERLQQIVGSLTNLPAKFTVHPKLKKLLENRVESVRSGQGIDWGTGEMLALGSLLLEGTNVRFTGQDAERGTFSHRHAVLHDHETGKLFKPLQYVGGAGKNRNQGKFDIINTMLSEEAVVGFEWGFASADPRNLVVWEAQFGDFVNGAQSLIDQILAASESKWRYTNGLVLNLPHGYEGQGPEHSNAYLERFLSLCAENNMQVAVPTTPAQYFHLLRRQVKRKFRKPLVLMTPKSLLRKPEAASRIEDFADRQLQLVIDDPGVEHPDRVRRVLLCSGKVYYTLDAARQQRKRDDVAILRIEQLYPFPEHELKEIVARYRKATEIFWAQEEPANRGAWTFMQPRMRELWPDRLIDYRGRDASASPATGSPKVHNLEEQELVENAFDLQSRPVATPA